MLKSLHSNAKIMESPAVPFVISPQVKREEGVEIVGVASSIIDRHKSQSKEVTINFVTPVYFPIYFFRQEGVLLGFDPSLSFSTTIRSDVIPDGKSLLERLRKYSKDEYSTIGKSKDFFSDFKSKKSLTVRGLLEFDSLNLPDLVGKAKTTELTGMVYEPAMTYQKTMKEVSDEFSKMKETDSKYIQELEEVKKDLFELTRGWVSELDKDHRGTPGTYSEKISKVRQRASERIREYNSEINNFKLEIPKVRESYGIKIADTDKKIKEESVSFDQQEAMLQEIVKQILKDYQPKIDQIGGRRDSTSKFYDDELTKARRAAEVQIDTWEKQIQGVNATIESLLKDYSIKRGEMKGEVDERIASLEEQSGKDVASIFNEYVPKIGRLQIRLRQAKIADSIAESGEKVGVKYGRQDLNEQAVLRSIKDLENERNKKQDQVKSEYQVEIDKENRRIVLIDKERDQKKEDQYGIIHQMESTIKRLRQEKTQTESKIMDEKKDKVSSIEHELKAITEERDSKIKPEREKIDRVIDKREKAIAHLKSQRSSFVGERDGKIAEINSSIGKAEKGIDTSEKSRDKEIATLNEEMDEVLESYKNKMSYIHQTVSGMGKDIDYLISLKKNLAPRLSHLRTNSQENMQRGGIVYLTFYSVGYSSGNRAHISIFPPSKSYAKREKKFSEAHFSKDFFYSPFQIPKEQSEFVEAVTKFLNSEFSSRGNLYESAKILNRLHKKNAEAGARALDEDGWMGGSRAKEFINQYAR